MTGRAVIFDMTRRKAFNLWLLPLSLLNSSIAILASSMDMSAATQQTEVLDEICPTTTNWVTLDQANDLNGRQVQLAQARHGYGDQNFYSVLCVNSGTPCRWLAPPQQANTWCEQAYHLVPALVVAPDSELGVEWRMIRVPSGCTCVRRHTLHNMLAATSDETPHPTLILPLHVPRRHRRKAAATSTPDI